MKKKYVRPTFQDMSFDAESVLTASGIYDSNTINKYGVKDLQFNDLQWNEYN